MFSIGDVNSDESTHKHFSWVNWQDFTLQLISNHFQTCTFVHVRESGTPRNYLTDKSLQTNINLPMLSFHSLSEILSSSKTPLGIEYQGNFHHRYSSFCKFVFVTQLPSSAATFVKSFSPFLTNKFTKRDEHHYVFLAETTKMANAILGSSLRFQIRYKIVIHPSISSNEISISTSCIYCINGNILTIPTNPSLKLSAIYPDFTLNFHQYPIRVGGPTKYIPTLQFQKVNQTYRLKRGVSAKLFLMATEKLNMSYTLKPCSAYGKVPEGSTGTLVNGTWAGCMGDAIRNISDIFLSVSYDSKRFADASFTRPFGYVFAVFATAKPGLVYNWTVTFTAFVPLVWLLVAASLIITTVITCQADKFLPDNHPQCQLVQVGMNLFRYLIFQDFSPPKPSVTSKFIYIMWLLCGFVISAAYVCSLQALIVSPSVESVPQTFSELINSKSYKWGASSAFRNGLAGSLFKNSNNPKMKSIFEGMQVDNSSLACNIKAAKRKYACFNWEVFSRFMFQVRFADKSGSHPFQMSSEGTFFIPLVYMTRKGEIFRENVGKYLARAFNTGLTSSTMDNDWRECRRNYLREKQGQLGKSDDSGYSQRKESESFHVIGLSELRGSFYILLVGLLIGKVGFLIECTSFYVELTFIRAFQYVVKLSVVL